MTGRRAKRSPAALAAAAVVVVLAGVVVANSVTIVDSAKVKAKEKAETFDPVSYVNEIWDSKLVPTITSKGADLGTILSAFEVDANGNGNKQQLLGVARKYGSVTVGEANVYMVKAAGTITAVDPLSLTLKPDGYDGPIVVKVLFGTRIPSDETSVRDSVGFLNFGDFKEQTQYGQVANAINKRITTEVIAKVDKTTLQGKRVEINGSFGIRTFNLVAISLKQISLVPVVFTIKG